MKNRYWWHEEFNAELFYDDNFNFKWTPVSGSIRFDMLKLNNK